jgi:hypothetical protein
MKKGILTLSIFLIVALVSCRTAPVNYDVWLGAQDMPSQMDISGKWDAGFSMGGGWGEANLVQQDRNVNGLLGFYAVKGVVSGKALFMQLISNGYVYYTTKLELREDGSLSGMAYKEAVAGSPEAAKAESYPLVMRRMQ